MNYYAYNQGGSDYGPFTIEQLRAKLASGALKPDKSVRPDGTEDWCLLSELLSTAPSADGQPIAEGTQIVHTPAVIKRYKDAYLVARATDGIGGVVKFIGALLGIIIVIAGFVVGSQGRDNTMFVVGSFILAAIVTIPFYVLGVLVSAHGQVLKASLDEAVHTSPFLTDHQRASAMSLI